ncbi:hypothetical protein LguiB_025014 [Lonicera macranthoides]
MGELVSTTSGPASIFGQIEHSWRLWQPLPCVCRMRDFRLQVPIKQYGNVSGDQPYYLGLHFLLALVKFLQGVVDSDGA